MLTLNDFLLYFGIAWATNISLNLLGTAKMYKKWIKLNDQPLDGRAMFAGYRLLGDTITVFGFGITMVISLAVFLASQNVVLSSIPLLVYIGGLVGSFIKRRLKIPEGQHMVVIDHGDYMIVTGLVLFSTGSASLQLVTYALLATYVLHPISTFAAYKLRLRVDPL